MTREQINDDTKKIVSGILKNSDFDLADSTKAGDIKGWDSLNHMVILTAIEKHFQVKFSFAEILNFTNMGDMYDSIENKLKQG
jgi:acyl carrier protein